MSPLDHVTFAGPAVDGVRRARGIVSEEWGIVFAQGGVVMATMLRAGEVASDRDDLLLTAATATFCRPVPCGPVDLEVSVLRSGRNGSQVQVTLRPDDGRDDLTPAAVATVVLVAAAEGWPEIRGLVVPDQLRRPPRPTDLRIGVDDAGEGGLPFFRHTDWRLTPDQPADPLRRTAWFAFTEPPLTTDGTWAAPMLAVPADALGLAAVPPVVAAMGPLTAPSLQMGIQFVAPARGEWIGVDSGTFAVGGAVATGLTSLWNADGSLVATATQTAILRPV